MQHVPYKRKAEHEDLQEPNTEHDKVDCRPERYFQIWKIFSDYSETSAMNKSPDNNPFLCEGRYFDQTCGHSCWSCCERTQMQGCACPQGAWTQNRPDLWGIEWLVFMEKKEYCLHYWLEYQWLSTTRCLNTKYTNTTGYFLFYTSEPWNIPKGVMSGQEMLYMTTMESINNILAYCSPNLEDQDKALHAYSVETWTPQQQL